MFGLCLVEPREDTVDIDPLANSGIPFQPEFVIPQFVLPDQEQCHRAHGIEPVVQKETKSFDGFLFQKMGLIKDTNHLHAMYATEDLDLFLELPFSVTAVKMGFQSKLIQEPFVEPPWCQLGIGNIKE